MKIQLNEWKLQNLSFSVLKNAERTENSFKLSTGNFFPEKENNKFGIVFNVLINDVRFDMNVEISFVFELEEAVTEVFKVSDFLKVNAPAIAFPYVRAFISNITLQSGFEPIILPSINFANLGKD